MTIIAMRRAGLLLVGLGMLLPAAGRSAEPHPLSPERRDQIERRWRAAAAKATQLIDQRPDDIALYSRRGDAWFFLGEFDKAVADFEKMVELDPDIGRRHWRLGIALFYAGKYKKAARQFELYHTYDDVDRENGLWLFLCRAKSDGIETARKARIRYARDDRPPLPDIYRLYSGETSPQAVLAGIAQADIPDNERQKRYFYAHLYIGLLDLINGKRTSARSHLRRAVANTWAPQAGGGPTWMWHVARVQYEQLSRQGERRAP